jgi:hypothetical protein
MMDKFVQLLTNLLESNLLWRVLLLIIVVFILRGAYRIQKASDNNFDFLDLIRDFNTNRPSRVGFFYMVGAVASTVVYIFACTRPGVTVSEINIFTITYGGLFIGSQGWNKQIERPPDPPPVIVPTPVQPPQTQVNVNAAPPSQEDEK